MALKSFACPTPMTVDERLAQLEEQEQEQEEEQLSDESDTMF